MLTSSNAGVGSSQMEGFIVVETNFDVYAYTQSRLQIAIHNLFTQLHYRFSNMAKGGLQRRTLQAAYDVGITSEQVRWGRAGPRASVVVTPANGRESV